MLFLAFFFLFVCSFCFVLYSLSSELVFCFVYNVEDQTQALFMLGKGSDHLAMASALAMNSPGQKLYSNVRLIKYDREMNV